MPENTTEELPAGLNDSALDFFVEVMSGTWVKSEDPAEFAERFRNYVQAASTLASKFNQTVWTGWETGAVSREIKGTREQRDPNGQKPGRKAEPKSVASVLLKK